MSRLRELIRDVYQRTSLDDPRDIVAAAVQELRDDELRLELRVVAVNLAWEVIRAQRAIPAPVPVTPTPAPVSASTSRGPVAPNAPGVSRVPAQPHGRTQLLQDWIVEQQRTLVATRYGSTRLGKLTLVDLTYAEDWRRRQAAGLSREADRFERLKKEVVNAGVEFVEELDPAAFAAAWRQP